MGGESLLGTLLVNSRSPVIFVFVPMSPFRYHHILSSPVSTISRTLVLVHVGVLCVCVYVCVLCVFSVRMPVHAGVRARAGRCFEAV